MSGATAHLRTKAILRRIQHLELPLGVEVGVFQGTMSRALLAGHKSLYLYMVDNWLPADLQPRSYKDYGDYHAKLPGYKQRAHKASAINSTAPWGHRRQVRQEESVLAARRFADETFDFVFLDADHSVEGVQADIAAWWPKIKPGGFLCGHDYGGWLLVGGARQYFGVKTAVDAFAARVGVAVVADVDYTFFMSKPGN